MKKGKSFRGSGTAAAGAAGTESYIELWNPAASGVRLVVKRVYVKSAETSGEMKIKYHTAKQGSTALTSGNVQLGGSAHSAYLYGNNAASVSGTQVGSLLVDENTRHEFDFTDSPFIVDESQSFILENATAVKAITLISIEWDEIPE